MRLQKTVCGRSFIVLISAVFVLMFPPICTAQDRIAFTSTRDGNPEIYVMRPDGTLPTRLTIDPAIDREPSFSADGSKIAFTSGRDGNFEIYIMNPDGTGQTRLTNDGGFDLEPALSPDGSRIAFVSNRFGFTEIFVMNSDGTNPTPLTFGINPSFSPDGSKIVFTGFSNGNDEIYVINADGTNQTQITINSADDRQPIFSPDGSRIAFTSLRDGDSAVYIMNADGTNQTRLTENYLFQQRVAYSPDGSRIAFSSFHNGNVEIYAIGTDGTSATQLTVNPAFDSQPSWFGLPSAAPTLNNVTVTSPVDENSTAVLSGTISDPNADDAFTLTVDWGDGSAPQTFNYPAGTTSFTETRQYPDDDPTATASDTYLITLDLSDSGGNTDSATVSVTVNNVAPALSNIVFTPSAITAGEDTVLSGRVTDVGLQDSHAVRINWGDGTPDTVLNLAAGVTDFAASHRYDHTGSYSVTITASDDDAGASSAALNIDVVSFEPPNAPTDLHVDYIAADRINLRWTDNSNNESGFVIEQCRNKNCSNSVQIGQTGANETTFLDTALLANTQYIYRVRAVNSVGASAYSEAVMAKTLRR